jgi:N-acetylneuraminic acid mutarotase
MNGSARKIFCFLNLAWASLATAAEWETVETKGEPFARHEAAFIEYGGKFYLMGGRRIQPVSIYDPIENAWSQGAPPPMEAHHFQPVVWGDRIYVVGAMTGKYPTETPLDKVMAYLPSEDRWEFVHEIPVSRRRGGAGAAVFQGKIYLACGIVRGHMGGFVNWLDEYDPKTGAWRTLPNAPRPRDHFQSTVLKGQLYCAGGRTTSKDTNQVFDLTVPEVDVYDFSSGKWTTLDAPLPTPRAGNTTMSLGDEVIVIGGESMSQKSAHKEMEAWNVNQQAWRSRPSLVQGRHGSGAFLWGSYLYTCSGSGGRGGSPELTSLERLNVK